MELGTGDVIGRQTRSSSIGGEALHGRSAAGASAWRAGWQQDALQALREERERWVLWLPVAFGLGIALYFALPSEPSAWTVPLLLLALVPAAGLLLRQTPADQRAAPSFALALALLPLLGLGAAQWRTHQVDAPVIERRGAYWIDGEVLLVEARVKGDRLVLGGLAIEGVAAQATPATLRFSRRQAEPSLAPGDRIRVRAMLMPPSPPSEPDGFDFARKAFFERIGAVGYALGPAEVVAARTGWRFETAIARFRQYLAQEISAVIPGTSGAVAVALLTGLRSAIPDQVWTDMQIASTAHIISISGLHLSMVAGTTFFALKVLMALVPPLALRLPCKKIAAAGALLTAFAYLLISGSSVPAVRAFIMTGIMLVAVMADRNPFSMRLVAFAALVILLLQPESLIGVSFQMSFAAVIALIAVYETGIGTMPAGATGLDWRLLAYVAGVVLTTVIASTATAPLGVYHFGRLPTYGILANVVAVPLTAFLIMPFGMLGLLLLPLGLHHWCFALMAFGIDAMLISSSFVAALPGAALALPRPPSATLLLALLGGLWLALWKTRWRRLGLVPILVGMLIAAIHRQPDILVDARGMLIAVRLDEGGLALSPWQKDGWVTDGWLRGAGQAEPAPWPAPFTHGTDALRCDARGCIYRRNGVQVALARRGDALPEDCAHNQLVISYPRIETCAGGTPLIGPDALRASGGIALWLDQGQIRRKTVRAVRGERPWVR
jgi:competence protein ComEC